MPTTTPTEINWHIKQLCKMIGEDCEPEWVGVQVEENALVDDCFRNVRESKIEGQPVNGWTIWERKGAFIEAEAHCVLECSDGSLLDISPKPDGETTILFVRDPKLQTPPDGELAPANKRRLLKQSNLLKRWLRVAEITDRGRRGQPLGTKLNFEDLTHEVMMVMKKVEEKYP